MIDVTDRLAVELHGVLVGFLDRRGEGSTFRLSDEYIELIGDRPVLGQVFEDFPYREFKATHGVPGWFANLLPEGPLRTLVAKKAGVHESRDFFLLAHLGLDLPGAVVIRPLTVVDPPRVPLQRPASARGDPGDLRFSLAGVQLKFSANHAERGLTVPVEGRGGDWIVKLPDQRFENVPENEYVTMLIAQESGLQIPHVELVDVSEITGLPSSLEGLRGNAFAVRRFDREAGERIHIEDFAQVLGLRPSEKYGRANAETLARIITALTPGDDVDELVRRLAFTVLIGNADAHTKNWSLIYPDRRSARLSPGYDLLSTVPYAVAQELALKLGGARDFSEVSIDRFRRFAKAADLDPERVVDVVAETAERFDQAWATYRGELPVTVVSAIDQHLRRVPLLANRRCS